MTQPTPANLLRDRFGFFAFQPGQEQVIDCLVAGRSALAIFPTGGGKSLCYQLPALLLDGVTVVISPLIALMKDQVDSLQRRGIAAARLDSSIAYDEAQSIYRQLSDGRLQLLYIAPERLANERFLERLRRLPIALLAIDEAHCISEWGHNFRPDYLKIARLASQLRVGRVLALTATATPAVATDIRRAFGILEDDQVLTGFYRANLQLTVTPCRPDERRQLLAERLRTRPAGAAIVYVTLQRSAEQLATWLETEGFDARAYHAGLKDEERAAVQDAFMAGRVRVVVATIAFGMGIDKADIRAIYHYNLPKTLENYMQEIGRAGRDGRPSHCEILACMDDLTVLANFSYGDTPTADALRELLGHLLGRGEVFDISRYELSADFDIRPLVVATVLTYLELGGTLEGTGPFYEGYKFQYRRELSHICADFDPERAKFLTALLATAKKGRIWHQLSPNEAAAALKQPRPRVVAALTYLEERGDLLLQAAGLRYGYRRLAPPEDARALADAIVEQFARRETQDITRLRAVLAFAEEPGCLVRHLLNYFGETMAQDCGHCSSCLGNGPRRLPRTTPTTPGDNEAARIATLHAEGHAALAHHRQLTRFLCGVTSPTASKAKLTRHAAFGALGEFPFRKVLELAERVMDCGRMGNNSEA